MFFLSFKPFRDIELLFQKMIVITLVIKGVCNNKNVTAMAAVVVPNSHYPNLFYIPISVNLNENIRTKHMITVIGFFILTKHFMVNDTNRILRN